MALRVANTVEYAKWNLRSTKRLVTDLIGTCVGKDPWGGSAELDEHFEFSFRVKLVL